MSKKNKQLYAKLIANPGAGQVLKQASLIVDAAQYLMDRGLHVDVSLARPTRNAARAAKKAVKDGYDIIIAMGGDGTIGGVIRGMVGAKPRLGLIPAGTENDFALSLGIREDIHQACDIILAGNSRKIDLGRLRTKKTDRFDFFMVTTVGIVSTVFPMIKDVPAGDYGKIKDALRTLFKFDSTPTVYLTLDDQPEFAVETMLVTITNVPLIGLHNLVAPDSSLEDGLLDVSVYPGFSKAQIIAYFARTLNESAPEYDRVQRYRARKMKIRTSPKLDIAAEGLMMGKGTAWIKSLPGAIRVLAPEPAPAPGKPIEVAQPSSTAIQQPVPTNT
jgi:diacylglycerol kinase (ATP)